MIISLNDKLLKLTAMIIAILWIPLSIIVGSIGSERELGFWWTFIASLIFSPLVGLLFAVTSKRKSDIEHEKRVEELLRLKKEESENNLPR